MNIIKIAYTILAHCYGCSGLWTHIPDTGHGLLHMLKNQTKATV